MLTTSRMSIQQSPPIFKVKKGPMETLPHGTAVIIIDHGSRMSAANAMLDDVVRMYQVATGAEIVEAAHMELAEPTLEDATARCVARGARSIVVHPYFLAPGRHSTSDIPRMVTDLAPHYPEVYFRVTEPLGVDAVMAQLMHQRVMEALARD